MGHGSKILCMTIIIILTICILISQLQISHILVVEAPFNAVKQGFFTQTNGVQKGFIFIAKFRALLVLNTFNTSPINGDFGYLSPSPSPSPAPTEAPAPSPVLHIHRHAHSPGHYHHPFLGTSQNVPKRNNKGVSRKVFVAVSVSVGIICIVLFGIGIFLACKKLRNQRKKTKRNVPKYSIEAGVIGKTKYTSSSQNCVKKVSSVPGPDLFYLDSLGTALEPNPFCRNPNPEINNATSVGQNTSNGAIPERKGSQFDSDRGYIADNGEITVVSDEICEEVIGEDKRVHEEVNCASESDDDESFHSVCDSHSARFSNASSCSLSDTAEVIVTSQDMANELNSSLPSSTLSPKASSQSLSTMPPPLLPPAPPLPPRAHTSPWTATSSWKEVKVSSAATSNHIAPSESSYGSNGIQCGNDTLTFPSSSNPPARIPPPPPCAPPLPKGNVNSSSRAPPPPPPSLLTQSPPLGKDGSPLPKLKPLHWDKVRAAPDRSTVWDKLRSSSFEFDEEMIESLFGYNIQNTMVNDEMKSKTPSPNKHVLEPKRLQNITILSKALNVTAEQVRVALIRGDGLSLQELEALAKMVPTKEEEAKLSNYKGNIDELGSAEKFVLAMLKIPFAFQRVEAMLYRETFEDEVVHLKKSFLMLEEACKELRSSRLFLKLLEAVLKTGNRMNVGTIRGGAKAFKLDALLKLSDVKGTDGKTTLLHFVVQEIIRSEGLRVSESIMGKINERSMSTRPEDNEEKYRRMGLDLVSGLGTELCNVKKTATIDLDVLASSVSNLSDGMKKLNELVNKELIMEGMSNGDFVNSMRSFLKYSEEKLKEVKEDEDRVMLHVKEIAEYFHGNVSKDEANPLRIFVIVRDFLSMLDHVCKELRSSKTQRSPNPLAPFR